MTLAQSLHDEITFGPRERKLRVRWRSKTGLQRRKPLGRLGGEDGDDDDDDDGGGGGGGGGDEKGHISAYNPSRERRGKKKKVDASAAEHSWVNYGDKRSRVRTKWLSYPGAATEEDDAAAGQLPKVG